MIAITNKSMFALTDAQIDFNEPMYWKFLSNIFYSFHFVRELLINTNSSSTAKKVYTERSAQNIQYGLHPKKIRKKTSKMNNEP